ncbi:MAG TPA: exopolysaccharide biosynthesis polyprenyl glycosylphosphotransferase [Streptosporangiaceae bacterium]|nr:exopolysaccharide biosynthesis polyprenyl glycosylphosphotransferase [Streptosporangiaceae bacterium]
MASVTNASSSAPKDGSPYAAAEASGLATPGPREVSAVVGLGPRPVPAAQRRRSEESFREQLFFGDLAATSLAFGLPMFFQSQLRETRSAAVWLAAVVATLYVIKLAGLYRSWVCSEFSRQAARIVGATAMGGFVLIAAGWLAGFLSTAPFGPAVEGAIAASFLVIVLRWRFRRWLKNKRADGHYLQTVVLVGSNEDAAAMRQMLADEPELGYRIGGVVGKPSQLALWQDLPHAPLAELPQLADEVGAEGVILVGSAMTSAESGAAVRDSLACGLHVQFWPGLAEVLSSRIRTAPVSGLPMLYVEAHKPPAWHMAAKRAIDIAAAAILLPLVAPVLLAAAIIIKCEDHGPVIYRHRVIGRNGIETDVLKLRTMVPNAATLLGDLSAMNERKGGPLFKSSSDPRVTRIGRVLRGTSLDELPQLWDVLTGRMSLVGPRFALPKEAAQFDEELQRRTVMRPGITGLWQTEARDNPSFSAYRRLDLLYVDNWSLGLDLVILVNTAHAVSVRAVRALLPRRGQRKDKTAEPAGRPDLAETPGADS